MRWYNFKDDGKLDAVAVQVAERAERQEYVTVKLLYWYFRSVYGAAHDDMAIQLSRGDRNGWVDYIVYVPLTDLRALASPR